MSRLAKKLLAGLVPAFFLWQFGHYLASCEIEWNDERVCVLVYDSFTHLFFAYFAGLCASLIKESTRYAIWAKRLLYVLCGVSILQAFTAWVFFVKGTADLFVTLGYFLVSSVAAIVYEIIQRWRQKNRPKIGPRF